MRDEGDDCDDVVEGFIIEPVGIWLGDGVGDVTP